MLSGVLMISGIILIFTASDHFERIAIFPGVLFAGTALLQHFFGFNNFHWFGDILAGYFLLAGIATLAYFILEPVSKRYLIFGMLLSAVAGSVWLIKRYAWPWWIIAQSTWMLPLAIVIVGLTWAFYPRILKRNWQQFKRESYEKNPIGNP